MLVRSRSIPRHLLTVAAATLLVISHAAILAAQPGGVPPRTERIKLSGPRFGITYLGGGIVDSLKAVEIDVSPVITQFGWQWEKQFRSGGSGPTAVSEWVLLVGGLEQGAFLPSLSWLVGVRTLGGTELGVGPNLGPAGFALAFAGGITRRSGSLNLPINISVVPSRVGTRLSILGGFTMR
jgi:hypothetical protein